jgi:hypothetical protein
MPTVDLRFMVYDADKIKKATGYMLELNAASKDRVVAHDKEGHAMKRAMTATERYNKLSIKLLKIRTKDAEQGHMTAKQLDDQFERHQRVLKATESTLKDYIQTDRVAITQEKRKQKLIADSTKATVKYNNETDKLRDKYDSLGAAEKRYLQGKKDIKRAFLGVEDGSNKARSAMDALTSEYEEFRRAHESGTIVNAGNQFARYGDQAYRAQQRTKRFASVGLQQAGYQVNDFIVQVASGQNALVAFGQQGSQLAGIFGTRGAVVGAVIAAAAAIGNLIYQTYTATSDTRDFGEVVDDLKDSIETLVDSMEPLDLKDLGEQYGSMAGSMARMADSVRDLNAAIADSDFRASLEEYAKQSKGSIMSVAADMLGLADAAQRVIDISPTLLAVIAPRAYKGYASAGEEAGKAYAEDLAKGFGTGVSAADVENYFQQLLVAEQSGTAGDAARIIEEFEEQIRQSTNGFDTLTISGQRFVQKMQELREEYSQLQSAIDGSGLLQASQNRSNEASAKAQAAARKKALKLQEDIAKAMAKIAKDRQKKQDAAAKAAKKALEEQARIALRNQKSMDFMQSQLDKGQKERDRNRLKTSLRNQKSMDFMQSQIAKGQKERDEAFIKAADEKYQRSKKLADAELDHAVAIYKARLKGEEEAAKTLIRNQKSMDFMQKQIGKGQKERDEDRIKVADEQYERAKRLADAQLAEAVRIYKERMKLAEEEAKEREKKEKAFQRELAASGKLIEKELEAFKKEKARLDAAGDKAILTAQAEEERKLFEINAAYEKKQKELDAEGDLAILEAQARVEKELYDENRRYEGEQDRIRLREKAEAAREVIREQAEAARDLANQIERAARAYETFLTKGQSEEVKLAGLREKLRVLQEGGTSGEASAAERLQVQTDKIVAETNEQRKLQRALGNKRTETEAEITAAATKRLTTAQQTYDVELKIAKEQKSKTGGGKTPKSALDILLKEERSMKLKLDQREALIGLTDQEILLENTKYALMSKVQEQMATMSESDKAATMARIEGIAQEMAAREEQIKLLQEQEAHQKNVADTIANNMGSALTSIVDGTKSVSDAFKDMARAIIAELYQIYVVKQITGMISNAIAPYMPALPVPAANGNAFSNGNVVPYADGGVVGGPVYFPMNDGRTGLMGEAGPEAIMPLKRGKNGKLGVQADGGSGDVIIHQNFNFTANGDESVKQIIAQQAPAIANMTKKQIMDDRRRGGQMKQAFG